MNPLEEAYDNHISPLMAMIIALCKEHKINMVASFQLDHEEGYDEDDPLMCSTVLMHEGEYVCSKLKGCRNVLYPSPVYTAFSIVRSEGDS